MSAVAVSRIRPQSPASIRSIANDVITAGYVIERMAAEAGVSVPDLSAWLRGSLSEQLDGKMQRWHDELKRDEETKEPVFTTPSQQRIQDALETARTHPTIALVVGDAGIGKTWAARDFCAQRRPANPKSAAHLGSCHYVLAGVQHRQPTAILHRVAHALGVDGRAYRMHGVQDAVARRLQFGDLIVIDEAQFLEADALDCLRLFLDEYNVGLALLGNPAFYTRLEGAAHAGRFAHLTSRVGYRLQIPAPTETDVDAYISAWGISGRSERQFCVQIATVAGGLRVLDRVIRNARDLAQACERAVDLAVLRTVAKRTGDIRD